MKEPQLLSGNEAVALAARDAGVALGCGYPGTPSTEILEAFSRLGGKAQWCPNEKVALEVALGAAFADNAAAIVTMKHVGLNVAADPLFTAAYTGVSGALVVAVADDPGLASSQNEQDSRRYAVAAGLPMLEPSDSQEAYDLTLKALEISARWKLPVLLRLTTRVCHSKTILSRRISPQPPGPIGFRRDIPSRVMIPAYARLAHRKLRAKLHELENLAEGAGGGEGAPELPPLTSPGKLLDWREGEGALGIITSGISFHHACEAAPQASIMKLNLTYPLALGRIRDFAQTVGRAIVIEEGDPYLAEAIRAAGIAVEGKGEPYRFGELNVSRVRRILAGDNSPEPVLPRGKAPQLCQGCPHRAVFATLAKLECIVAGDIGCYTLGVLPPFEAMDSCVCMGASIGVGLGLRQVLPEEQAKKVVSVIGDSTLVHSGITGLVEMAYNPPPTGHVVIVLDNATTAMTGLQEHPGTGRRLDHAPTRQLVIEEVARAIGLDEVHVIDPTDKPDDFAGLVRDSLAGGKLVLIIARRPCILAAPRIRQFQKPKPDKPE
jgi:indolepyruvate ferredoxin oxidoreductase alpha subunit